MTDGTLPTVTALGAPTTLPPALVRAYADAIYALWWMVLPETNAPGWLEFRLGRYLEPLDAVFQMTGLGTAALVTATNPLGEALSASENAARHARLAAEVATQGHRAVPAYGRDPAGAWEREESLLIHGISREEAIALGNAFAQNAIVWSDGDFVPRLLLLR